MELTDILYKKKPPMAYVSLNRPETRNTFTVPMIDSVCLAIKDAKEDPRIKVIVLSGEGEAFSAGGNIKDMAEGKLASWDMKRYLWNHVQRIPLLMEDVDKPVIASIHGPAYGGGFDLALACDLRIASEQTTFCSTFVHLALAPGNGGAYFLPRLVGVSKALEILMTGRVVEMDEALRIGLVDKVVPKEALTEETKNSAMDIIQWPIAAVRAIKRAVYYGLNSTLRGHLDYVSSQLALLTETKEHQEAVKKFVKKKKSEV